jgi:hypothetical protein
LDRHNCNTAVSKVLCGLVLRRLFVLLPLYLFFFFRRLITLSPISLFLLISNNHRDCLIKRLFVNFLCQHIKKSVSRYNFLSQLGKLFRQIKYTLFLFVGLTPRIVTLASWAFNQREAWLVNVMLQLVSWYSYHFAFVAYNWLMGAYFSMLPFILKMKFRSTPMDAVCKCLSALFLNMLLHLV